VSAATAGTLTHPVRTDMTPPAPAPGNGPGTGPDTGPEPTWPPRPSPRLLVSVLPSLAANVVAPALAYTLIRPHLASNTLALLAAMAIPAAWTLATFAVRRRADRLGLISIAGFAIAVAATYLSGGSPLAAELQDPAETGAIGLAFLASVIVRRPLWLTVLRYAARHNAYAARRLADPATRRTATVETAIIGAIFLAHAIPITILALTLPTGTFVAVNRLIGLPILAAGIAGLIAYRRRQHAKTHHDATPRAEGSDDDQPS
jgi:hypothetical protein